jgi:hypothetical protein
VTGKSLAVAPLLLKKWCNLDINFGRYDPKGAKLDLKKKKNFHITFLKKNYNQK